MMNSNLIKYIVQSTQHLLIVNEHNECKQGSCIIIKYSNHLFVVTAAHVVDQNNSKIYLLSGTPSTKCIPQKIELQGFEYSKIILIPLSKIFSSDNFTNIEHSKEEDFAFLELSKEITTIQSTVHFPKIQQTIEKGHKFIVETNLHDIITEIIDLELKNELNLDSEIKNEINIKEISFYCYGLTKGQELYNCYKATTNNIVLNMKYERSNGNYHKFKLEKPLTHSGDLKGMSGSPIFDDERNIVAIKTHTVKDDLEYTYGIKISFIKEMIDKWLERQKK